MHAVFACMFTITLNYWDVPIVMYDCDFQGAHCMKHNPWLISPCTRGMTEGRLSVCFSSPSLFTGNFHVVNGAIDSRSVLFVLRSVHHLRREQEWKLAQVWLHGMGECDQWLRHDVLFSEGCLLHICDGVWTPLYSIDSVFFSKIYLLSLSSPVRSVFFFLLLWLFSMICFYIQYI